MKKTKKLVAAKTNRKNSVKMPRSVVQKRALKEPVDNSEILMFRRSPKESRCWIYLTLPNQLPHNLDRKGFLDNMRYRLEQITYTESQVRENMCWSFQYQTKSKNDFATEDFGGSETVLFGVGNSSPMLSKIVEKFWNLGFSYQVKKC